MIVGLHHVAIATKDLARLSRFYCDQFELQVLYRGAWKTGNAGIDAMVGLPDSSADRPVCDSGITHLCMQVTDIDSEYARLSRAGMRFHFPPAPATAGQRHRATYGRDPDGNVIELIEILTADHPFGTPFPA